MAKPPVKGHADYLALGDWNVACAFCGRKFKASECVKLPAGDPMGGDAWVCQKHWRPRQMQDFVRGIPENPAAPFVQPQIDTYTTGFCDIQGVSALPDYGTGDCAINDYFSPSVYDSDNWLG